MEQGFRRTGHLGQCDFDVDWPSPGSFTAEGVMSGVGRLRGLCDPLPRLEGGAVLMGLPAFTPPLCPAAREAAAAFNS